MHKRTEPIRILIVDDEPDICSFLERLFRRFPSRPYIAWAFGGVEGLRRFKDFTPDLILLDKLLPDGSGLHFCRAIRRNQKGINPKIVCMSGFYSSIEEVEAFYAGFDAVLPKPFTSEELAQTLKRLFPGCLWAKGRFR